MSRIRKLTNNVDTSYLFGNDKVMRYLQNSKLSSTPNSLPTFQKSPSNDLFSLQHRLRSCSENDSISSSSSSAVDEPSRSNFSVQSSLSDPVAHCSITSSNVSSADEELDFDLGFGHIRNQEDFDDDNDQQILDKNNADAFTLFGEVILDTRVNELEELLRQSSDSTILDDEYQSNSDDTMSADRAKLQKRAPFLYDSTLTLCSEDRFSAYTEDDNDEQENEQAIGLNKRSNSMNVLQLDKKSTLLGKAPRKAVRFADMMGLDLESVRYMSPPEQTTSTLLQGCIRHQFGQLRLGNTLFDIPNNTNRTSSSLTLSPIRKQCNLVSKHFTSPTNIIPLIYEKQVLLECLYTKDSIANGTIRVHNCAYDKHVFIRITDDEWKTSNDIKASHSMNYPHDNTDTFTFEISLPKLTNESIVPNRILFCICLQAMWQDFWDNNQEWNYVLDVVEKR